MLFQLGGDGSRPTFFEMDAAEKLQHGLKAALLYSLGIFAQRWSALHRVLDHSDEVAGLLLLLLEAHSLKSLDASFGEGLYGLRRAPVDVSPSAHLPSSESDPPPSPTKGLTRRQRVVSLFFLVGVPYLKSKLHSLYSAHRASGLRDSLWASGGDLGDGEGVGEEEGEFMTREDEGSEGRRRSGGEGQSGRVGGWRRIRDRGEAALVEVYPWIHALYEGSAFSWQLLYLLDAIPFYSPALQVMGVAVRRCSGQELMDSTKRVEEQRRREFSRLPGPRALQVDSHHYLKVAQRGLLTGAYAVLDYAQTGLVASIFLFKMLEWWYQSGEQRISAPSVYPPPPPPPPPKVAKGGLSLPSSRKVCPLCLRERTNPAMAAASGFVFCYPCIFNYIQEYKRCPITLLPTNVDHIRRLYHNA